MIIDGILNWIKNACLWFLSLFPSNNLSVDNTSWTNYLINANQFINMPLLMTLIGIFVTYELSMLTVRLILWVWNVIKP